MSPMNSILGLIPDNFAILSDFVAAILMYGAAEARAAWELKQEKSRPLPRFTF